MEYVFLGYKPLNENEFIQNIHSKQEIYFNNNYPEGTDDYYHKWDENIAQQLKNHIECKLSIGDEYPPNYLEYDNIQNKMWKNLKDSSEITTIDNKRVKVKLMKDVIRKVVDYTKQVAYDMWAGPEQFNSDSPHLP
ncbi:MAG: hypothetical protein WJU30_00107 [Candidatus Phytoplasma pruni]